MEIESIKKSQTEQNLEMKNLGTLTGTSEASLINGKQKIEERTSGIEDTVENMDSSKKVLNIKKSSKWHKTYRKFGTLLKDQISHYVLFGCPLLEACYFLKREQRRSASEGEGRWW